MAALLGPSWKSRQPRMCQYCQRMFSNKFNLKQVTSSIPITTSHPRIDRFFLCLQHLN